VRADVAAVLRGAEPWIRSHPDAAGVSIDWNLASGLEAELSPLEIEQLLINLASNALEAMRGMPGAELRIAAARWGGLAIVSVADTGRGVPPDMRKIIFRSLVTTKPKGMGIGLYVCHAIATAHGGRIWVEAGAEGGAVFKFTLPLTP
jgi:signal transduction histidine kinase